MHQGLTPELEARRLKAIRRCGILDTQPEQEFDNATSMLCRLTRTPIAIISFVDEQREWFKSRQGLSIRQTPRKTALCKRTILQTDTLVIDDTLKDRNSKACTLVSGKARIRFYAGHPLRLQTGDTVGTIAALDTQPRTWNPEDDLLLQDLAAHVVSLLEARIRSNHWKHRADNLQTILDAVPEIIYVCDDQQRIIDVNQTTASLVGLDRQQIIGKTTDECFSIESNTPTYNTTPEPTPHLGIEQTYHFKHASRLIQTDRIPIPDEDDEITRLLFVGRDVTRDRRSEHDLWETTQRLELSMRGAHLGAWDLDLADNTVFFNTTWYTMLGYETQELPMHLETWETLVHPDDLDRALTNLREHCAGHKPLYECEVRMKTKSGDWKWIRSVGQVISTDSKTHAPRLTGVHIDIDATHRLMLELKEKNDALEQSNIELERFVYAVSHDLKSPIVTILGYCSHMDHDINQQRYEELPLHIRRIKIAAAQMGDHIDGMLELSRIRTVSVNPEPISFTMLYTLAMEQHLRKIRQRGIQLDISFEHDTVWCERAHLTRILDNLISNAIQHGCHETGGHIRITTRANDDGAFELTVADHGPGIPQDQIEQAFGIFQRLNSNADGAGVGLAVTRRICRKYNGSISVEETPGGGATFRVTLPAQPANEHSQPDEPLKKAA